MYRFLLVLVTTFAPACHVASASGNHASTDCPSLLARAAPTPVEILPNRGRIRFVAIGDAGDGDMGVVKALSRQIASLRPDAILLLGDNFYSSGVQTTSEPAWERVRPLLDIGAPLYPILGNHDHHGNVRAQIEQRGRPRYERWRLPALNYVIRSGDLVEISMLDSTPVAKGRDSRPGVPGVREILCRTEQALMSSKAEWKLAVGHHPLETSGVHQNDRDELAGMGQLLPIFERTGVALYLAGHDHNLEFFPAIKGTAVAAIISGAGSRGRPMGVTVPGSAFRKGSARGSRCMGAPNPGRCTYGFAVVDVSPEELRVGFRELGSESEIYSYTIRR